MPEIPEGRITVYSWEQINDLQQGFIQELKEIHSNIYNILIKHTNKIDIKDDLVKLLGNVFDRQVDIQKDINIETQPDQE